MSARTLELVHPFLKSRRSATSDTLIVTIDAATLPFLLRYAKKLQGRRVREKAQLEMRELDRGFPGTAGERRCPIGDEATLVFTARFGFRRCPTEVLGWLLHARECVPFIQARRIG